MPYNDRGHAGTLSCTKNQSNQCNASPCYQILSNVVHPCSFKQELTSPLICKKIETIFVQNNEKHRHTCKLFNILKIFFLANTRVDGQPHWEVLPIYQAFYKCMTSKPHAATRILLNFLQSRFAFFTPLIMTHVRHHFTMPKNISEQVNHGESYKIKRYS